jgi:hypothetical protein
MVIVIVSSPSGSFSITTLRDGDSSAPLSGLWIADDHILPFCRIGLSWPNQNSRVCQVYLVDQEWTPFNVHLLKAQSSFINGRLHL